MPSFPKPEPRAKGKRRESSRHAVARKSCRLEVLLREQYRCRRCGLSVSSDTAHVHEIVYRSRGGDATDASNCIPLCPECHRLIHDAKVTVEFGPLRANGPLQFHEGSRHDVRRAMGRTTS